jgi:hypothetical protein
VTDTILEVSAQASDLINNMAKTQYFSISCVGVDMDFLTQQGRSTSSFPCHYLGCLYIMESYLEQWCISSSKRLVADCLDGRENFFPTLEESY